MPLQLLASNSLNNLYKHIEADLRNEHLNSAVFHRPAIVTQTEGINSWLRIQLAEGLGIAANYEFLSPNDLIAHIYFLLGGSKKPPMRTDQLQWLIYELLGTEEFIVRYRAIHQYYVDNDIKRLSLAAKTADLFDQYQIYRTEIIQKWTDVEPGAEETVAWQQYLWHHIRQRTQEHYSDKTLMNVFIQEALRQESNIDKIKTRLPSVYFFGLAVITPAYLRIFHELSKHISIRFYLINPAPEAYWLDTHTEKSIFLKMQKQQKRLGEVFPDHFEAGNDLLLNWGGIIRSGFSLLFKDEDYINVYDESAALPFEHSDTLLKKIQTDIYNNANTDTRILLEQQDFEDGSITINSVYSPAREVEVLYNYLVDLIETQKMSLAPRDIVVMVNDIDTYAPFIRAVFQNAPYEFPFKIADESLISGNSIFSAIHLILALNEEQLTVERILEIIENKYVAARFGISNPVLIRRVLKQSGIRFGIQGDRENDTRLVSWEYGLKRIMNGICISGEELYDDGEDQFYPLDSFEGDDAFEMVRFYGFIKKILHYLRERNRSRSIKGWAAYLKSLVNDLVFESGIKEDDDFHLFIQQIERLESTQTISDIEVGFDVFRNGFVDKLKQEKRTHSFLRGGITFCSYIPMRSIPFKVVCMLGLDFDKFPRKENPLSFSLFTEKIPGDRNVKENDKHLFLENILSAQSCLYLSYIGHSVKDGSSIPPSSLLDELIDYLLKKTDGDVKAIQSKLVVHHPLHGFGQRYFDPASGLVSYLSDDKYKSLLEITDGKSNEQEAETGKIELKQLISFFKNPVKHYFNKTLKIYYDDKKTMIPETELFELNYLEESILKSRLLELEPEELDAYVQEQIRRGNLPLKNMGFAVVQKLEKDIEELRQIAKEELGALEFTWKPVHITLEDSVISGSVGPFAGGKLVALGVSSSILKNWVNAYINFLAARVAGMETDLLFISRGEFGYTRQIIKRDEVSVDQARELLNDLVKDYKAGQKELYCFYPEMKDMNDFVSKDDDYFNSKITKLQNDPSKKYLFENEYLMVAGITGYFDKSHFESFKTNTQKITQRLKI